MARPKKLKKNLESVILIHGILNRPFIMTFIKKSLENEGFRVYNWGYKSREKNIEEYAAKLKTFIQNQDFPGPIHFVGFSLGAIIARTYLSKHLPSPGSRLVQIAPPNHGSPWIDTLFRFRLFRWIYGDKAILQLRTDSSFLKSLGVPRCPFGIIAGSKKWGKSDDPISPKDNDGSVPLTSTQLPGATDFIRIKSQHTLLLFRKSTVKNIILFLKTGFFLHPNVNPSGNTPIPEKTETKGKQP